MNRLKSLLENLIFEYKQTVKSLEKEGYLHKHAVDYNFKRRINFSKKQLIQTLNSLDHKEKQQAIYEWFKTIGNNEIVNQDISKYLISFFFKSLEDIDRTYLLEDYLKTAEEEKYGEVLWLILQSAIDNQIFELFSKALQSLQAMGFMEEPIDFTQERFDFIDHKQIKKTDIFKWLA